MTVERLVIREYTAADESRVIEITRTAWVDVTIWKVLEDRFGRRGDKAWWEHKVGPLLASAQTRPDWFLVAVIDGLVVGYARYHCDDEKKVGTVGDNAVDPAWRGRGIGSALHAEVLRRLQAAGMEVALVGTGEHQVAAQAMYEKHGFRPIARRIEYVLDLREKDDQ